MPVLVHMNIFFRLYVGHLTREWNGNGKTMYGRQLEQAELWFRSSILHPISLLTSTWNGKKAKLEVENKDVAHCLKITQNVAFEFLNFGLFHQFLSYYN